MTRTTTIHVRAWMMTLGLLATLGAGCAGDGCLGAGPIPGGFPPEERAANALQLRITDSGIDVLTQDPNALVENLLGPDGLVFAIPAACGPNDNPKICCDGNGDPISPCSSVELDIVRQPGDAPRLALNPVAGQNRLDAEVRARVRSRMDFPIEYDTGFFDVTCDVRIDSTMSGSDDVIVAIPMRFVQDGDAGTLRIEPSQVDIQQFASGDLALSGGFDCAIADLVLFAFIDSLVSSVEGLVEDTLADLTCKPCPTGDVAECGPFADSCEAGVCVRPDGECLQELGISSRIPASALLAGLSPGTSGAIDLYDVLGGFSNTDGGGLTFGALGGALPGDASRRCGPSAEPPAPVSIAPSPFFQGNSRPDTGQTFDIGLGLHSHQLDELAYSAYESGFLCMNIGTSRVDLLSTDTLSLVMPSILDFVHGKNVQVVLGIRPQAPPEIILGAGTFTPEGTIDQPLLDISLPGLEIDFYAMIDDQFVRVMTLAADVRLAASLDVSPDGGLVPVARDLEDAFSNLRVLNSEALAESPTQLAERFPAILDLALPMIVGSLGEISLPTIAGLEIQVMPGGITSVDNESVLAIFADLAFADAPAALTSSDDEGRVVTEARVASLRVPEAAAFAHMAPATQPAIDLELGGRAARDSALEWSYRLDQGMWSPYSPNPRVTISRPSLWLQGRHRIEVRAREVGAPQTTDRTPVMLEPVIDVTPPQIFALERTRLGYGLGAPEGSWILARDSVSATRDLVARYRLPGSDSWRELALPGFIPRDMALDREVIVEVRDQVGNARTLQVRLGQGWEAARERWTSTADARTDDPKLTSGCSVATREHGPDAGTWLLWLLATLGLIGYRARPRGDRTTRVVALSSLALVLLASACGGKDSCDITGGAIEPGATGRYSDIAALGGRVVVSAYEESLGDLVLLDIDPSATDAEDAIRERQVIDGAPTDVEPTFIECSYRGGVLGAGPNVGAHTSVALARVDGKERARVAYQDIDNGGLRFALEVGRGDWRVHELDSGDGGVAGLYSALAIDADGRPAVAYPVVGIPGNDGARISELRLARANTTEPATAADWTIQVLDQATISCAGLCAGPEVCVTDTSTREHCVLPTEDCVDGCGTGVCVDGTCQTAIPEPPAYDLPLGTGLFPNLAFLPDERVALVYYDREATALVLRVGANGNWTSYDLDATPNADTGMWASMDVGPDGVLHVAYQDALADRLLYTTWQGGQIGPVEVIDDGLRAGDRPHPVGASAALVVDDSGRISVAYQDALNHDLLVATREVSSWTRYDLATGQNLYGFFVSAARHQDTMVISSYLYDRYRSPFGELMISRTP